MSAHHISNQFLHNIQAIDYMRRNPNLTMTEYCRVLKLTRPRYYRLIKLSRELYGDKII